MTQLSSQITQWTCKTSWYELRWSVSSTVDVNVDKTKLMIISKDYIPYNYLNINENHIDWVHKYIYLSTIMNNQWNHSQEIRCQIEKSRAVFNRMANVLKSHDLSMDIKIRLLRCSRSSTMEFDQGNGEKAESFWDVALPQNAASRHKGWPTLRSCVEWARRRRYSTLSSVANCNT